jgi:hypothetical protein
MIRSDGGHAVVPIGIRQIDYSCTAAGLRGALRVPTPVLIFRRGRGTAIMVGDEHDGFAGTERREET